MEETFNNDQSSVKRVTISEFKDYLLIKYYMSTGSGLLKFARLKKGTLEIKTDGITLKELLFSVVNYFNSAILSEDEEFPIEDNLLEKLNTFCKENNIVKDKS